MYVAWNCVTTIGRGKEAVTENKKLKEDLARTSDLYKTAQSTTKACESTLKDKDIALSKDIKLKDEAIKDKDEAKVRDMGL